MPRDSQPGRKHDRLQVHIELLLMVVEFRRRVLALVVRRFRFVADHSLRAVSQNVVGQIVQIGRWSTGKRGVFQIHQEGTLVDDAGTSWCGRVQRTTGRGRVQVR